MSNTEELLSKLKPMELPLLPENPLVSVLIANYNYGQYIGEAIESVLNQTYQNFEIIICDDGSTDNSLEVIKEYAKRDGRIKYIAKENGGVASALNVAYAQSKGDIIAFLDADDVFTNNKLQEVVQAFRTFTQAGLLLHKMRLLFNNSLGAIIPIFTPVESGYLATKIYQKGGQWTNIGGSSICLRREISNKLFPIDELLFQSEADAFMFTLAPLLTEVVFLKKILAFHRVHGKNLTAAKQLTLGNIYKALSASEKVISGVNARLKMWGFPTLDINQNLNYITYKTYLVLLGSDTSIHQQINALIHLTKRTFHDDLLTCFQKLGRVFIYWTMLLLPKKMRLIYLQTSNHTKLWIGKLKYIILK